MNQVYFLLSSSKTEETKQFKKIDYRRSCNTIYKYFEYKMKENILITYIDHFQDCFSLKGK